jgi:hypothetical protein
MSSTTARKTFALANDIVNVSPQDEIYVLNAKANKRLNDEAPWKKELSQAAFNTLTYVPTFTFFHSVRQSPLLQIS